MLVVMLVFSFDAVYFGFLASMLVQSGELPESSRDLNRGFPGLTGFFGTMNSSPRRDAHCHRRLAAALLLVHPVLVARRDGALPLRSEFTSVASTLFFISESA